MTAISLSLTSQERQCRRTEDDVCGVAARKTLAKFPVIRNNNCYDYDNDKKENMMCLFTPGFSASLFILFIQPVFIHFQRDPCGPVANWTAQTRCIGFQDRPSSVIKG